MALDVQEQIEHFQEFLQSHYENKIHDILTEGKKSIVLDFKELAAFDIELAEFLLNDPENATKAAEVALSQIFIPEEISLRIRFENLPESQRIEIRNIRSVHLNKFLAVDGIVRQTSDVRPQVTMAKFECPSCGNTLSIIQVETRFKEPSRCTCGRRGTFRLIHRDLVDAQRLVIEEVPEKLEGGAQPKRISVFLKEDLVEPKLEKKTTPGSKVRVNGIVREVPIMLKTGAQSIRYDLMIDANYVEPIEETFEDVEINKEDEEKIIELSKDPYVYERLRNSIAPSIFGHENIKDAVILQLMGGVKKEKKDGTKTRGNMHILLVGDPGSAKSTLLLSLSKVAPKARYVAGKGASAAGLCIAPDSLIMKNPGELTPIKYEVEKQLENGSEEYSKDIYRTMNKTGIKVYSVDPNLKINTREVEHFWKIKAPKEIVSITLQSGKKIELTKNTKLLTINKEGVLWKKAMELRESDHIATAREINVKSDFKIPTISLISRKIFGRKSSLLRRDNSRAYLNKFISRIQSLRQKSFKELDYLKILGRPDLLWERIKYIGLIKPTYEYVYDITVKEAHNFIANGIIVHNTASVVKDEFLKGWALEAGTLVLANGGYAMIDELDKISTEDTSALHEVLANEQVSISKANIQAVLRAETTLLSAANPKFGRFDPYQPIAAQINLPPALINRFDLIFPVRDIPNKDKDEKIASHVLETMRNVEKSAPEIPNEFVKKYVAYARQKCKPILTNNAIAVIKKFYVDLRNSGSTGDEGVRPIPISARQLEAIVRLSEASARVRMAKKVTSKDAERAIKIMTACLEQVGIDPKTGKMDIDIISTGIAASTRSKIVMLREIIINLSEKKGKTVAVGDIIEDAQKKDISETEVYDLLEKLKKEGELFEPKKGFISRI
ncbi:minichromosome maintenance protein MCM [Candidatus Woesearchaeota archaeon]|nr:minichromosome maintenance protein MCM [Candidatus Woesearchaeota archaeon]